MFQWSEYYSTIEEYQSFRKLDLGIRLTQKELKNLLITSHQSSQWLYCPKWGVWSNYCVCDPGYAEPIYLLQVLLTPWKQIIYCKQPQLMSYTADIDDGQGHYRKQQVSTNIESLWKL